MPTAEGRALPPEQTGEHFFAYEYHYKDHLGNLRAAFRKAPTVPAFRATMEPASAPLEEAQFDNIARTRSSEYGLNPPVGPRHSARVGPMPDGTRQVLGPWRTISVKQGDRLQAQVFAYYTTASPNNESQRVRLTAFVNPQAAPPTGEQTQNLWDKLKLGLSFDLARSVDQQDNSVPVAYLKYIVYDKDYKPLKDDYIAITSAALAANGGWEGLSFDITASDDGYVQVLVANESEKPVWFDDLEIKHSPALIVQENHYDPWGLNLAGIEKQGQPDHKFQYLNREKQEELGLNWLDLKARMYDPQLGRFHAVDPKADVAEQETQSPYQYGYNNPITNSDPDGDCPKCLKAIAKTAIKSVIKGKVDLGEVYDAVDAVRTIVDPSASIVDKGLAVFDLVSPVSSKEIKAGAKVVEKIVDAVDNTNDAAKTADKVKNGQKLLPEKAGPTGKISASEVENKTPAQIDQRAKELGLEAKPSSTNAMNGKGSYIDPQTGKQRMLSHPNSTHQGKPNPHGHVNDPDGNRIDSNGNNVPAESEAAHLPIRTN